MNTKTISMIKLYELAFESSKQAMLMISIQDNEIVKINSAALSILNIKNEESILYQPIAAIKNNKKIELLKSIIESTEKKGKINLAKDDCIYFDKMQIAENNASHLMVYLNKKIEIADSYRDLFDNTNELLYIMDDNFTFIDVNKSVVEKYGYTKKEIIGKTPALFDAPGLNDMEAVMKKLELAKKGKNQQLLWWSLKKNGDIFLKELNFRNTIYKGKSVLIASGRDISEKYNYENNLAEKEKRYRQLFERNLAGVYQSTLDGKLLECNDAFAKILGFSSHKDIQKKINVRNFYLNKNSRCDLLNELENKQHVKGKKINLINQKGEEVTVLMNVSIIEDDLNKTKYLEGSFLDITNLEKAQKLLKRSEENYRQLLNNLAFGIIIFFEKRIIYTNRNIQQLLHFKENELFNSAIESLIFKKDKALFSSKIKSLTKAGDIAGMEIKLKRGGGSSIDAEVIVTTVDFDYKKCIFISFLDIGYRKKAAEATAKSKSLKIELRAKEMAQKKLIDAQSYMEGIIESSLDMIFTCDTNNRINKLNDAAIKELGINNADALNKNISIIFFNKNQAKTVLEELQKKKKYMGEVQLKRDDGSIFPAYLSLSYLYNSDNEVLGKMGVSRDITELKRNEIEYKRQAIKLNSIIESSSHFFLTINRNYVITSFNHVFKNLIQKDFGEKVQIGMNFFDLYSAGHAFNFEENIKYLKNKIDQAFKGEKNSVNFEFITVNKYEKVSCREVYLNPIYNDNGKIIELSAMGHDITDKKLAEKKVNASLKEKEVLLKEVHHRVKNNMQVISSILNLQSNFSKDKQILDVLHESQNRIKSMALIHERLYQNEDFSSINFTAYIKELTENLVYSYKVNKPSIELNFVLNVVYLKLDTAIPCGLILNELISNSLKYAFPNGRNGKINIELKEVKQKVILKIEDDGIGIPEIIKINSTKSLGLQLVNTLVNQLEGSIRLNRKKGTNYTIEFEKTNSK